MYVQVNISLLYSAVYNSRSASVIKKALVEIISTLRSRNFFVKTIMTDGEGSVGAVATDLKMLGIELDISGAGGQKGEKGRKEDQNDKGKSACAHIT